MINILYAASDSINSKIQLSRFLNYVDTNKYNVKIAAYKKSSPKDVKIDWTLNCLYNMFTKRVSLENSYLDIYYKQIKSFSPDLIISDMEYYSTYIGNSLGCEVWQCSSSLIYSALDQESKYNSRILSNYFDVFKKNGEYNYEVNKYLLNNSNRKYIYSYFCDIENSLEIKPGFEWVRPYFIYNEESDVCKHDVVAATLEDNSKIINLLKKYNDSVLFSSNIIYNKNIINKNINNDEELSCNIKNCNFFICEGFTNYLADCFYNEKSAVVMPNLFENECIINSLLSKKFGLCDVIYNSDDKIKLITPKLKINESVGFLNNLL